MSVEMFLNSFVTGFGIGSGIFIVPFLIALALRVVCVKLTVKSEDYDDAANGDQP